MTFQPTDFALSRNGTELAFVPAHVVPKEALIGTADQRHGIERHLVTTRSGFAQLEGEWSALFERAGRPEQMFQNYNWLWHWANHFLDKSSTSLAIVTLRRSGRLVGVVPLVVERAFGLKQLSFMGAPVSQYGDAIIEPIPGTDQQLADAIEFAIRETKADLVRLPKVRDDAAIAPALTWLKAIETCQDDALHIDLAKAGSFAAYEQRFSNKARKNRRRQERRLAERGAIEVTSEASSSSAAASAQVTLTMKRAWLKARGQISKAFADPRTDAFFTAACGSKSHPSGVSVSLLRTGGEIANAALLVNAKGHQALHVLSLGLKFEKCAAGVLHTEKLIEQAFERGFTTFDFLAPRHDYKTEWADGTTSVRDYVLPVSRKGHFYTRVYLGYAREKLKTAIKAMPSVLRGPLSLLQRALRYGRG